jgi:hypothetical protein
VFGVFLALTMVTDEVIAYVARGVAGRGLSEMNLLTLTLPEELGGALTVS